MKRNLAIIGAGYLQLPLIERAKSMGYTTHVFAWNHHEVGQEAADVFHPINIIEKYEILAECRALHICGICSIASELAVDTVNYVAEKMGLPGNGTHSTLKCTNKHFMRLAFEEHHDPSPRSVLVEPMTDISKLNLQFPVIVKPTDRSGSRGVSKIMQQADLTDALKLAFSKSLEKKALIEEFVEGKEYSVEYISYQGKHMFLALTEKQTTGAPHYIETGHREPANVSEICLEHIQAVVSHALDSLEIKNGASHSEIKMDEHGNIKIIEIGARMGGDSIGSDLVKYSTGVDFVRMVIQVACGDSPDFTKVCRPEPVECKFIFTEEDIDELHRLQKQEPEKLIRIVDYHPENIGKITDSTNRAGCYIRRMS